MAAPRKPQPVLIVRLVGPGIRPWAVPVRALARVLDAVQRVIDQRDDEIDLDEGAPEERAGGNTLHLLSIKSSSAAYHVAAREGEPSVTRVLSELGRSLSSPNAVDWSDSSLSSVRDLSEVAKTLDCEIEFRYPASSDGGVIAKITPLTYQVIAETAFVYGATSVFARVERVGGATARHCGIRIPETPRKMVICRVKDDELVRKLGQYMYDHVTLHGEATWLKHNLRLKSLDIQSVDPPQTGSLLDALKAIHDAGGHAWDDITDPDAYIKEGRRR